MVAVIDVEPLSPVLGAAIRGIDWRDPLDAVHEENRFQRDTEMLGEEGALLWARFDKEMDRLHATQFSGDLREAGSTN